MRALPRAARLYFSIVTCLGLVAVWLSFWLPRPIAPLHAWELALFAASAFVVGAKRISRNDRTETSDLSLCITFAIAFAAMLRFGPLGAVLVGGLGSVGSGLAAGKRRPSHLLYSVSLAAIEGVAASEVFLYVNGATYHLLPLTALAAAFYACMTFYLIRSFGMSLMVALSSPDDCLAVWHRDYLEKAPCYLAGACIGTMATLLGGRSTAAVLLFVAPLIYLSYQTYCDFSVRYAEKQKRIDELQKNQVSLMDLYLTTVRSLALAIDAKDQYTHQHILRVQRYAMATASKMGLAGRDLEGLNTGALLHDIGKLGIPEHILLKPGRLTEEEFYKVQKYPEIGAAILDPIDFPWPVLPVVKYHHEKWDGTGYPSGLAQEEIPVTARILALADVYDALTSDRPYRKAWSHQQAVAIIRENCGTHFDPAIAEVFLAVIDALAGDRAGRPCDSAVTEIDRPLPVTSRSSQAARAIHEASTELWALYEVAQTLSSSLSLQEILEILARKLEVILPGTACLFLLQDEDSAEMRVHAAVGINREFFLGATAAPSSGLSQQVVQQQTTYFGEYDPVDLMLTAASSAEWVPLSAAIIVPIVYQGAALGSLNLYHPSPGQLTEHDQHLLEMIAQRVAMAIKNARRFDRACSQARTDPLTGLCNLRHLTETVQELCGRRRLELADSYAEDGNPAQPFALLCLDLDYFKPINDNFGHNRGDDVLKDLADLFRQSVRAEDTVARYGGDEFLIVLDGAGPVDASIMAERIQLAVREYDPGLYHETLGALRLDVSIGWACFPQDGLDCASLLSSADSKMYRDKTDRKLGRLADRERPVPADPPLSLAA